MEEAFAEIIRNHIMDKAKPKFEKFEKDAKKRRKKAEETHSTAELESILTEERQQLEDNFKPENWLTNVARRAGQRQLITHAQKYTNQYIKCSSVFAPGGDCQPNDMPQGSIISTASLSHPAMDSSGNAAALDVDTFLELSYNGKSLTEYIHEQNAAPFQVFSTDETQLKTWMDGFSKIFTGNKPSSNKRAKQIYFPLSSGGYHLLSPIFPSSLVQAIHERIITSRFSDNAKSAKKAKREGFFHEKTVINYVQTAVRTFGGTKPQNISRLNSVRRGKSYLLSCAPPTWQNQKKPPLGVKTIFSYNHFGNRAWRESNSLRRFLEQQTDRNSTMAVRSIRAEKIDQIIDLLIQYGAEIQSLQQYAGWSALTECKLSRPEQLWLDPHRTTTDKNFSMEREKNDWQEGVANQFAFWLNQRIGYGKLTPGDNEHREWQNLLMSKLGLLKKDLEEFH